jgi:UDP-glucuronate decarboxylase
LLSFLPAFAEELKSTPVIITGAGGWLGQAALEMLDACQAQIYAFGSQARTLRLRSNREITVCPLEEIATLDIKNAIVFHFAFLTREHANLDDYIAKNRKISSLVQGFLQRNGARGIFNPSSGAAYTGTMEENPYGALKREDEQIFGELSARLGFPATRMRIFNLAGPFINKLESYALACIITDILKDGPITLRAAHPVWRGYAHVQDVINIGLGGLLRPSPAEVFGSAGEPIEIGALASRAAALLGKPNIEIQRPDWQSGPPNRYLGNQTEFTAHAKAAGVTLQNLDAQIFATADFMSSATN